MPRHCPRARATRSNRTPCTAPAQLTFFRVTVVALLADGLLLATNRRGFRISRRQLAVMAILGVAGVALIQWLYAVAISLLPMGIALMLEYTGVLIVALVARFVFTEQVKPRIWLAIGTVLIGMAVVAEIWVSTVSGLDALAGILAAICLAVYLLVGERLVATTSSLAVSFWSMLFASAFWLVFSVWWQVQPHTLVQDVALHGNLEAVSLCQWLLMLWNGVFGSFAPYLLS